MQNRSAEGDPLLKSARMEVSSHKPFFPLLSAAAGGRATLQQPWRETESRLTKEYSNNIILAVKVLLREFWYVE